MSDVPNLLEPTTERERLSVLMLAAETPGQRAAAIQEVEAYLAIGNPDDGLTDELSEMVLRGLSL